MGLGTKTWAAAVAGLAVATLGCIGSPQSVGSLESSSTGGTGPSVSTTQDAATVTSSSTTANDDEASGGSAIPCDPPCVSTVECQVAQCVEGSCTLTLDDTLCEQGQVCSGQGCVVLPGCAAGNPDVLMCDDFEDGIAPQWEVNNTQVTNVMARNGEHSLKVSSAPGVRSQLAFDIIPGLSDGMVAIRAFFYIPETTRIDEWAFLYELLSWPGTSDERLSLDLRPERGLMFVNLISEGWTVSGQNLMPTERWVCVEVRMQISDDAGEVEVRVDDVVQLTNGPGADTLPGTGLDIFVLGALASPEAAATVDYFIDDVVVSTAPVGCL